MSMIDATAQENTRVPRSDGVDAAPPVASRSWRVPTPVACAAGFAVALAAGGAIMASQVGQREPPLVAAAEALESAPRSGPRVVGNTAAANEPVERPAPPAAPDGQGPIGVEGKQTGDGGIVTGSVLAGRSDDPPVPAPATGQPIESPGSGLETWRGVTPDVRASTEAAQTGSSAERQMPADASWSPALAPAIETRSTPDQADAPATGRVARIVSDVNMRTGPSNGEAVVATIPRGSPVEVIACRQWCEVIFTGQRGWVYKSFLDPSPSPGGR
jgi:hypothetical protein